MATSKKVKAKAPKLTLDMIKKGALKTAEFIAVEAGKVGEASSNLRLHIATYLFKGGKANLKANKDKLYRTAEQHGGTTGSCYKTMTAQVSNALKVIGWKSGEKKRGSKPKTVNLDKINDSWELIEIGAKSAGFDMAYITSVEDNFIKPIRE
jgi:hypothetical protein